MTVDFEVFRDAVRDALYHLQDQDFSPNELLTTVLDCGPGPGAGPVQAQLLTAINALEPEADAPVGSRSRLLYQALHSRYILGMTQEETAGSLHMSVRNVQRVQGEAIHALARFLWRSHQDATRARGTAQASDWQSQAQLEVATLQETEPNVQADVGDVIEEVIKLETALAAKRQISVVVGYVQPDLTSPIHPSVLRQTLITAISNLMPCLEGPELTIYGTLENGQVKITLTGALATANHSADAIAIDNIIAPPEATVELQQQGPQAYLQIHLPAIGNQRVLVIEDNLDMVHFYRRCTNGTTYSIVHMIPDDDLYTAITDVDPSIIVLDVMLPNTDGWQTLSHLSQNTATRDIPVIVCSVVKERELALALGATDFLSKPIRPRTFVTALDRARHRDRTSH